MKKDRASDTAAWVATARSVGALLPPPLAVAQDPYGVRFARRGHRQLAQLFLSNPRFARRVLTHLGPFTSFLLWMQLRTRVLDDVLLEFVRSGGRQVVLLGAGYDCRGLRFARELAEANLYEVDHPATQARKLRKLPHAELSPRVAYVGWDFERDGMAGLPERLEGEGLDPRARVLTLWEGVTMYLSETAIDQTVRAVHQFGARDSWLAFNYIDARRLDALEGGEARFSARIVAGVGEPWRFGWDPTELADWFAERGYGLIWNASDLELSDRIFAAPPPVAFARGQRYLAVLRTL